MRQRQLRYVCVNEGYGIWLGTDKAKVTPFINIFHLLWRGNDDVMIELRRHKATHIITTPYIAYGWWRAIKYLMTIKCSLIRGFLQARFTDVINRPRPIGPENQWTMQSLQLRPLLKHDAEDRRRHFFVDHVFCIFKKELMKYVVLECVHVSLHYNLFFIFILFSPKQWGVVIPPPRFKCSLLVSQLEFGCIFFFLINKKPT
jgi:hypothetical protein